MSISLTDLTVLSVACNTRVCEFLSLHVSAYCCQCRLSMKVSWFLQLSPAVNNALLGSGDQDPSLLTSNRVDFQRNLQINRVDKCVHCCCKRHVCCSAKCSCPNYNRQATDDDYFAFSNSADSEASQAASDITRKCDLKLGRAAVSRW